MTRQKLTQCRRGHPFDDANTHLYLDEKGRLRRVCRKCAKRRNPFRQRPYGLSTADYEQLVIGQNGVCALCGRPSEERALAVDHDHASGHIRGLLCAPCHTGLGAFHEDPQLLRKAIAYLEAHRRGQDVPRLEQSLSIADREQISAAFDMVLDGFMTDIFALRFLVGTARLRDRIAEGFPFPATCVGEELALRAVMRTAVINVTASGDLEAAQRLEEATDSRLPDLDFMLLFERNFNLSREQACSLGAVHLWIDDWFRPFDQNSPLERSALN